VWIEREMKGRKKGVEGMEKERESKRALASRAIYPPALCRKGLSFLPRLTFHPSICSRFLQD
jgi:hypothetical protein